MPALTSLVLKDRATTPVDHTFTPSEVKDGIGTVVESTGMKLGDSKYSVSSRKTAGGRYAGKLKLEVPVVENQTVNGVTRPVVTRVGYATVDFSFAAESTTVERNNLVGMLADSLAKSKTLVDKTIVDLEGVWG